MFTITTNKVEKYTFVAFLPVSLGRPFPPSFIELNYMSMEA